jgi:hypothetical protein
MIQSAPRHPLRFAILAAGLASFAAPFLRAADSPGLRLEVIVNGRPLAEYAARGQRYIEAQNGREYALRITNTSDRRVAVALAVDGLNTIDARHSAPEQARKWVLEPRESAEIAGWQVAESRARAFYFTRESASYGAWLGDTRNLGNIEAVAYYEKFIPPPPKMMEDDRDRSDFYNGAAGGNRGAGSAQSPAGAPAAEASGHGGAKRRDAAPKSGSRPQPDDEYAATGIGRDLAHPVESVSVELESHAFARLRIRYEYRDALIKLGVLPPPFHPDPRTLDRREQGRGFGRGWAPEPLGRR